MIVEIDLEKLSEKTKIALAGEKELNKTIQQMLARDESKNVKIALIQNPSVLEEIWKELIKEDEELAKALAKNSEEVKKFEILLEREEINVEDAILIAKIHDRWLSSRLFSKMETLKTQPWFRDVVEIWANSDLFTEEKFAAQYIYLFSIEKQRVMLYKYADKYACYDIELLQIAAEYIDSKEVLDFFVNDIYQIIESGNNKRYGTGYLDKSLINNRNYDISKLAKIYIIERGDFRDEDLLESLAMQEMDNEILLKLIDFKDKQIRQKIWKIIIERKYTFSLEVYEKLSYTTDPVICEEAAEKAYMKYKTLVPYYKEKFNIK